MKKGFLTNAAVAVILTAVLFNLTSCEKDEGKLPDIEFLTGGSYTSADKTITAGDAVLVGIHAEKTEDKDVLKTFNIQHTVGTASAVTDTTITLTSAEEDMFSKDFTLTPTAPAGSNVKYTFTVTNRDGLVNNVSFTLTIN